MNGPRILVVRLGSMGDVVAALPAVASLKHSIPHSRLAWVIEPKWSMLLQDNPYVDSRSNGLVYAHNRMKGQLLAAHIKLTKGERSRLAELAADLL